MQKVRARGIFLLPNLLTTASLFAAFYAIVAAMQGRFITSAMAIFIAMIADTLDGRVARLTQTQSAFGAEYDSLSDMVAFGAAPALVAYSWALRDLGKVGWLVAFVFTATTALRLARFNTQLDVADKKYFQGLPSPSAAAIVASAVWLSAKYGLTGYTVDIIIAVLTFLAGGLMVSHIPYYSFKEFDKKVSFLAVLALVFAFVGISMNPALVLFCVFFGYALSGPLLTLWEIRKKRQRRKSKS